MAFLKSFTGINRAFLIIAFSPFLIKAGRIETRNWHKIITLSLFGLYEAITIYSTYDAYLRHGIEGLTQSTFTVSSFMRVTLENIMQCLTVIFALTSTNKHIELLEKMQNLDQKLNIKLNLSFNYYETNFKLSFECLLLLVIVLSIDIFKAIAFRHEIEHFDDLVFIFCISCQMIMLGAKMLYVRHIARIMIMWVRSLRRKAQFLIAISKMESQPKTLNRIVEEILDIAHELADLKNAFEDAFGYILLFTIVNEVICLTFKSYFVILGIFYPTEDQQLSLINHIGNIIPYLLKLPILVLTLNDSTEVCRLFYDIAIKCSSFRNNNKPSYRNLVDLIFLNLQHMKETKYISARGYLVVNRRLLLHIISVLFTHMVILMQFQQLDDATDATKTQTS